LWVPTLVTAGPDEPALAEADKAGPDFAIQGEYQGQVEIDGQPTSVGAQAIARGNGRFRLVGFRGGLPGQGWSRGDEAIEVDGTLRDGAATFDVDDSTVKVNDGAMAVIAGGQTTGILKKVVRKSPTLGAKPPAGAIVLFDGSGADQFVDGKLVEGKWLGATGAYSKQKFGDHALHLEFRTPFMPQSRGQGRGNSGVYVQSRYELQILDSFGLDGKNNECGGFYKIAEPRVNMCFPPLSWQTYDIDFTAARYDPRGNKIDNARVTVRHNGVVIHDDLELPHHTPGRHAEGPVPDALFLQDHGNPVVFRNIWVVPK
jgi:hypothetical protein